MSQLISRKQNRLLFRIGAFVTILSFLSNSIILPSRAYAQNALNLPAPGSMVTMSPGYAPVIIKAVTIHPENPLKFDFIVDLGKNTGMSERRLKEESSRLIRYFLASLTVPEKELWVNLSPYEKDRIIPESFGVTEMGRDLLAEDYILKQLTASLMYPEKELGKKFWDRVYKKALENYGTTSIPINTFNKVWIVPDKAVVYEHENTAFVVESSLKVMLEKDYLALEKNLHNGDIGTKRLPDEKVKEVNDISSLIVKEIIVPEIEKEVNEGTHFAKLRQIYNSMILATWFKKNLRESLIGQVYVDQNKTFGIEIKDKAEKQKIFSQYLETFKKGVFNYIKEDYDPATQQIVARKYFSGGFDGTAINEIYQKKTDLAMLSNIQQNNLSNVAKDTLRSVGAVLAEPNEPIRYAMAVGRSKGESLNIQSSSPISTAPVDSVAARKLREEDYLASKEEQERVFDQVSGQTVIDQGKQFVETSKMAREVFRDVLRAAGLNPDAYQLFVLNNETSNAFIIPYTTRAYINVGLIREVATLPAKSQKGALAFVLGHEITHIAQYRKRVEQGVVPTLSDFKIEEYIKRHIERYTDEYGADANALFLVNKAGYSVRYATSLFEKWEKVNGNKGEVSTPWGSHPKLSQRFIEIKKAMRKSSWRSWGKAQNFSDEVSSELPKISRHVKFLNRVEEFSGRILEERFSHMHELLDMINEAPDYEALLFVLQHVYYYTANFFDDDSVVRSPGIDGLDIINEHRKTNFSDDEKKQFVEESLKRFLKRAG